MQLLAFDVEISHALPQTGDVDYSRLGISCAATLTSDGESRLWHSAYTHPDTHRYHERMTASECKELLRYLQMKAGLGYTIVTWNGNFDFRVLGYECYDDVCFAECRELAKGMIDPMMFVVWRKRHYLSLEKVTQYMLGKSKTGGLHGGDAPWLWSKSMQDQMRILTYCAGDVALTLEICQAIQKRKVIEWISGSGRGQVCSVPTMYTLKELMKTHLEYVPHWMTNPADVEGLVGWLHDV